MDDKVTEDHLDDASAHMLLGFAELSVHDIALALDHLWIDRQVQWHLTKDEVIRGSKAIRELLELTSLIQYRAVLNKQLFEE